MCIAHASWSAVSVIKKYVNIMNINSLNLISNDDSRNSNFINKHTVFVNGTLSLSIEMLFIWLVVSIHIYFFYDRILWVRPIVDNVWMNFLPYLISHDFYIKFVNLVNCKMLTILNQLLVCYLSWFSLPLLKWSLHRFRMVFRIG